jgi:transcriptional regulator NrdR family protein
MSMMTCPYCDDETQVEGEDYSETPRTEECRKCGKRFTAWEEFSVDTTTEKIEESETPCERS